MPGTSTVVVQGGFDAGARFDVTRPSIPVINFKSFVIHV